MNYLPFLAATLFACMAPLSLAQQKQDDRPVEDARKAGLEQRADPSLPTLWIIGDSTVKVGTPGQRGWGDEISPFFDTKRINVVNRAIGGRSSRTFITEGRWADILAELRAGDFVLMQFGHNDASPINEDPPVTKSTRARGTIRNNSDESVDVVNILTGKPETVRSYGWYMRQYTTGALEKGATPIVCSLIPRKNWSADGKMGRASTGFGLWAKQAAEQTGARFVDLNEIIARSYEAMGKDAVELHFADKSTHTTVEGARHNARSVIAGLRGLDSNPLEAFLSETGRAVEPFKP